MKGQSGTVGQGPALLLSHTSTFHGHTLHLTGGQQQPSFTRELVLNHFPPTGGQSATVGWWRKCRQTSERLWLLPSWRHSESGNSEVTSLSPVWSSSPAGVQFFYSLFFFFDSISRKSSNCCSPTQLGPKEFRWTTLHVKNRPPSRPRGRQFSLQFSRQSSKASVRSLPSPKALGRRRRGLSRLQSRRFAGPTADKLHLPEPDYDHDFQGTAGNEEEEKEETNSSEEVINAPSSETKWRLHKPPNSRLNVDSTNQFVWLQTSQWEFSLDALILLPFLKSFFSCD